MKKTSSLFQLKLLTKQIFLSVIITFLVVITFFYISQKEAFNGYYIDPMKFSYLMIFIGILIYPLRKDKTIQTAINIIAIFLFVTEIYWSLEMWQGNNLAEPFDGIEMMEIRLRINYFLILSVLILFMAIFGNIKRALIFGVIAFSALGFASYVVLQFRGEILLPSDIVAIRTAAAVAGTYHLKFHSNVFSAFVCSIAILPWALDSNIKVFDLTKKTKNSFRLIALLLSFLSFYIFDILPFENYYYPWFIPNNGYTFAIAINVKLLHIVPDSSYSDEFVYETIISSEDVSIISENYNPQEAIAQKFGTYEKPNIVCVMNESWSDLTRIGELELSEDLFDYTRSLENTVTGNCVVEVFGGGTSDSEFTFLTGDSTKLFATNARAYELYINENTPSLVEVLDDQGYKTIAVHPDKPTNWNRDTVYPMLGFEEFITEDAFDEYEIIRDLFVSDKGTYQKIEEIHQENIDSPLFVFSITMQNHGSYDQSYNNLEKVEILNSNYPEFPLAEQYLSLANRTDEDFSELVDYFSSIDEPTIVLMFGDHLPKLDDNFYNTLREKTEEERTLEEERLEYTTPFIIWANYELPDEFIENISINYLSTLLIELTGLEKTPFNNYLENLYHEFPVIDKKGVITNSGRHLNFDEISEIKKEKIIEYDNIIYNNLFDLTEKNKELFNIEK